MIEVNQLSKTFTVFKKDPGFWGSVRSLFKREWLNKEALKNATFSIKPGEIVGLIGANGAGKTTLVKLLAGIIYPASGTASVLGFTPWERKNAFRRQIGLLMGQKAQLWWDLTGSDCFILLREIYQIPENEFRETLEELSASLNIKHLLDIQVRRLSLGERMKMELIASLLHRPKVLYLDEPTLGLDITSQRAIRKFLLDYSKRYKPAMLITSHYMEDIEELCERIMIIREGTFVYDGPLQRILKEFVRYKVISLTVDGLNGDKPAALPPSLGEIVSHDDGVIRVKSNRNSISETVSHLLKTLPVIDLTIQEEDIATIIEQIMTSGMKEGSNVGS